MNQDFIENSLVILTKPMLDVFLKQKNPSELISLYIFYYYTAKWQKTNQPKCTTDYVSKGLHWTAQKVRNVKKQLIELGLVEDVKQRGKHNKIAGHYIKINFIFSAGASVKIHTVANNEYGGESHPHDLLQYGNNYSMDFNTPNALSTLKLNASSTISLNALSVSKDTGFENKKTFSEQTEKDNTVNPTTKAKEKVVKHKYGEYGWVQLTDKEYQNLVNKYTETKLKEAIEYIDLSAEATKNKYGWKSWSAVIHKAIKGNWGQNDNRGAYNQQNKVPDKYSVNKDYSEGWD